MSIWLQRSALIQLRTSPLKFDNLVEKLENDSVSNLSTKAAMPNKIREIPYLQGRYRGISNSAGEHTRCSACSACDQRAVSVATAKNTQKTCEKKHAKESHENISRIMKR